ncbi:MAG: hypothetical protein RIQ60_2564 [Pseudomonadota bacterium]|jgi:hypothetical protein
MRSPRALLRQRLDRWWARRHPPADSVLLEQRTIYIVPTRGGWCWAAMVLVLLLGAINYQLNLGYLLCFVLAGVALVSMHSCHATLRGLRFTLAPPEGVFAGARATLDVTVQAERGSRAARHGIGLVIEPGGEADWVWVEIAATVSQASTHLPTHVVLTLACLHRGRQVVPRLRIETRFPFGLFRAWSFWQPAAAVLVWPAPEHPLPPWPQLPALRHPQPPERLPQRARHAPEDPLDVDGVRPYRIGDSPRQVAWKKSATALNSGAQHALVSRSHGAAASHASLALNWQQAGADAAPAPPGASAPLGTSGTAHGPAADGDARLARLCAWLLQAEACGLAWSLDLPGGVHLPAGHGAGQRLAGLRALALFEVDGAPPTHPPPKPPPNPHPVP